MTYFFEKYFSIDYEKINWYDYFLLYLLRDWMKLAFILFSLKSSSYWKINGPYFFYFLVKQHVESHSSKRLIFPKPPIFLDFQFSYLKYINKLNFLQKYYISYLHNFSFLFFLTILWSKKFDSQKKNMSILVLKKKDNALFQILPMCQWHHGNKWTWVYNA